MTFLSRSTIEESSPKQPLSPVSQYCTNSTLQKMGLYLETAVQDHTTQTWELELWFLILALLMYDCGESTTFSGAQLAYLQEDHFSLGLTLPL